MPYITSVERHGIEQGLRQGLEQGLEQGREQGLEQGRLAGKREALRQIVQVRFGSVSETLEERVADADEPTLDALIARVVAATSVDEL